MPQNMFQTISSFFISLTIFVGGIFGFTPPPQPEASVATSTPKIEQVIPAETTATKKAPSISTQKSQTEKLPILYLSTGELNKKATSYLQKHSGLIIFKKIKEQVL